MPGSPYRISEQWRWVRVHWHAYEIPRVNTDDPRWLYRSVRLRTAPDAVLTSPAAVVEWIERKTREHITPAPGTKHETHNRAYNLATASRGDSIYTSLPTSTGAVELFVEALVPAECTRHQPDENSEP